MNWKPGSCARKKRGGSRSDTPKGAIRSFIGKRRGDRGSPPAPPAKEPSMDLIYLVLVIALIGLLVLLITTKIPMPPFWATAIQILALGVIILYLVTRFVNLPNVLPR